MAKDPEAAEPVAAAGRRKRASSPGKRGPGRPPGGGDSREAIVAAAVEAFRRDGVNASIRDIALEASVSQSAFYHYFPTKEALLREAAATGAAQMFARIGRMTISEGEPEDVFRRMAEAYLETFAAQKVSRLLATMLSEGMKMPGFLPAMGSRMQEGIMGPMVGYLEGLRARGHIDPQVEPVVVGQMLFGTLFSFMMVRHVIEAPWAWEIDPAALTRQVAYVLAHGIGGVSEAMGRPAAGARSQGESPGGAEAVATTEASGVAKVAGGAEEKGGKS